MRTSPGPHAGLAAVACLAALGVPHPAEPATSDAVALVVSASGRLTLAGQAPGAPRELSTFDWLPAGAEVESAEASGATLALASGRRYELGPRTRVRVGEEALETLGGSCRELARVTPLPRLPALSPQARAGSRSGALRIRGRRIPGLVPPDDTAVLADAATLSFAPVPGIDRFVVEVEDEEGEVVFHASTHAAAVVVSPDVLKPGARYRWLVRGSSAQGPARGEAEFSTLDAEAARARQGLRSALEGSTDPASLALLAEVDRGLGLLREARETFARALALAPGNADLAAAVERLDAQMRPPPE